MGGIVPNERRMRAMRLAVHCLALALGAWAALASPRAARAADGDPFALAAEHYRQGRWEQACDAFDKLLAADPPHARAAEARFYCGEALVQLGRWDDARRHFAELLKTDAEGSHARQARFRVGEAAYMLGDDTSAKEALRDFCRRYADDPLNAYALPYLGSLELQSGNAERARKLFSQAAERFKNGPLAAESRFGLAQAAHQSGQLEEARRQYRAVIDGGGPLAEPALLQLGAAENALGKHQAALAALEQFAARFPKSPLADKATLGRGYALLKLDRPREAQEGLASVADVASLSPEAPFWLALAQKAQDNWRAAAETLRSIHTNETHPLAPAIGFHTGDALLRDGQLSAAQGEFERVLARSPTSGWADDCQLGMLRVAIEQKEHARCVELADALISKFADSPLVPQAMLAKGQALSALGKPAEAIAALEPLVKKGSSAAADPQIASRAWAVLAVSRAELGRFDEAQKILADLKSDKSAAEIAAEATCRVAELAQKSGNTALAEKLFAGVGASAAVAARAQSGLAWSHFQAERWAEASEAFGKLLAADPKGPLAAEAALLRARSLEHLEQFPAALDMYRSVIEQHSDNPRVAEALWRRGRLHEQLDQPDAARRDYAALVEKHRGFAELDAALHRFAHLERATDPKAAGRLFERLRSEFPDSPLAADATLRLAELALAEQKLDEAGEILSTLDAPDASADNRRQALYLSGRLAIAQSRWADAETPLTEVIETSADDELGLSAAYLLAEADFRQGRYDKAAQRLADLAAKTAGRTDEWLATAELRRAQTLGQLRRWDEALETARGISERFAGFEAQYEADYLMGRALAAKADFAAAREWYEKAILAPAAAGTETAAMARWMKGESYFHQEDFARALAEYRQVDERYPRWHSAGLLQGGKCAEALDRWSEAVEAYERLIEKYPQSELTAEATRRLDVARHRAFGRSAKRE
jgi:TolA-binding protein